MPSYNVKQIAYTSPEQCVQNVPVDVYNMQGSAQAGDDPRIAPYQQIVLQPRPANDVTGTQVFSMNKTYYLSLTLPKNLNYDMQYAIRLIKLPEGSSGDLDQMNYQFIKYITSRKVSGADNDNSRVVLFQQKDEEGNYIGDTMVRIAEDSPQIPPSTTMLNTYKADHMYYYKDTNGEYYYWCTVDGRPWPHVIRDGQIILLSSTALETRGFWTEIGKNDVLLSHSWKTSETDLTDTYKLIFKPRVADLDAVYLHLIPTPEDNDIQWQLIQSDISSNYYGRHIDIENIEVELYELKDLFDVTARRFGIWGRPGLMFDVEGEEIRIGPSGYYELHDFTVNELGVAAFGPEDRFTIDVQYS